MANAQSCGARFRKPVVAISDRAKRYRANSPECRPAGPRVCAYCPSTQNVEVHHKNGDESDGRRSNLAWACRSCNTRLGAMMARKGKGKRTRQFNPRAQNPFRSREQAMAFAREQGLAGALPIEISAGAVGLEGATAPGWYLLMEADDAGMSTTGGAAANPPDSGAASLGEYLSALRILKGEMDGDFEKARTTIHNTPVARRSEFAREIWAKRGGRGGRRSSRALVELLT